MGEAISEAINGALGEAISEAIGGAIGKAVSEATSESTTSCAVILHIGVGGALILSAHG